MLQVSIPGNTILSIARMSHPLRFLYSISLAVIGLTVALPAYFVLQSEKFMQGVRGFFERISTLTLFYLFFDFVGLVIVIIRNV
jgi:hypothetical protein